MLFTATAGSRPARIRGRDGPSPMARNADLSPASEGVQRPIQPAVFGRFNARRAGLHKILSIEVRTRGIGRTGGVHDRQMALFPQRLES